VNKTSDSRKEEQVCRSILGGTGARHLSIHRSINSSGITTCHVMKFSNI